MKLFAACICSATCCVIVDWCSTIHWLFPCFYSSLTLVTTAWDWRMTCSTFDFCLTPIPLIFFFLIRGMGAHFRNSYRFLTTIFVKFFIKFFLCMKLICLYEIDLKHVWNWSYYVWNWSPVIPLRNDVIPAEIQP